MTQKTLDLVGSGIIVVECGGLPGKRPSKSAGVIQHL